VTFKRRRIVVNGNVYGWNHEYDCRAKQWAYVYMNQQTIDSSGSSSGSAWANTTPRYPLVDFSNVFGGSNSSGTWD
jgi:hypothetical protein